MQVVIVSVGENNNQWHLDEFNKYHKRLPSNIKLQLIEVPILTSKKRTESIINKESQAILQAIPDGFTTIALSPTGSSICSNKFAKLLYQKELAAENLCFLIGGPEGLTPNIINKANLVLSFSELTFPHMLCRIILVEQIYRSCCINSKHPYAK